LNHGQKDQSYPSCRSGRRCDRQCTASWTSQVCRCNEMNIRSTPSVSCVRTGPWTTHDSLSTPATTATLCGNSISHSLPAALRFFAQEGRHVAPMGVKFGAQNWTEGPLLHTKFHPHRCIAKGIRPPKLNFLLRFYQNWEYERQNIAEFVPRFRMR